MLCARLQLLVPEMPGIDWGAIDNSGKALKAELLKELTFLCEPADIEPPGASGPPTSVAAGQDQPTANDAEGDPASMDSSRRKYSNQLAPPHHHGDQRPWHYHMHAWM